jgi:hypothetical protein
MTFCMDSADSGYCFQVNHDCNVHSRSSTKLSTSIIYLGAYVHANTYKAALFVMYKLVLQGDYLISWAIKCSKILKGSIRE